MTKVAVTGGAGFIGSNLVEYLLKYNARHVRVLDNLSNGYYDNINKFIKLSNFEFIEGDIRDIETCKNVVKKIDFISHQAALGSVPRSIANPILTNEVNVGGFLNYSLEEFVTSEFGKMLSVQGEFSLQTKGAKYKVPVITGVQVAKDAWNSADITLESVPESKAIAETADTFFAIIRTEEMKRQNIYRFKLLKQRDGDFLKSQIKLNLNSTYLTLENDQFIDQ